MLQYLLSKCGNIVPAGVFIFFVLQGMPAAFSYEPPLSDIVGSEDYVMSMPAGLRNKINSLDDIEAERYLRKIMDKYPRDHVLWNALGVVSYSIGDLTASDSAIARAIEIKSDYALAWRNLAVLEWDNGNWDKAIEYSGKAAGFDHSDINIYYAARAYVMASYYCDDVERKFLLLEQALVYYRMLDTKSSKVFKIIAQMDMMVKMRQ